MNADEINISAHAVDMFYERYKKAYGREPFDCLGMIQKLIARAIEVMRPNSIFQEVRHGEKARYFSVGDWYFITNITGKRIITILNRRLRGEKRRWPKRKAGRNNR